MTEKKEKKQEILINCSSKNSLSLDDLTIFQGNLKDLSDANYEKIKKSILDHGIISPWHIWNNKDKFNILDATQRTRALLKMRDEGYKIPKVPVVFITAKSIAEAKRMVLALTSQYGNMTHDGLHEFINEAGISFDELKESFEFPEIDLAKFEAEFFESTDGNTDADEVPEVDPASVITKTGDLIELGNHRLLCGDCTIKENVGRLMSGENAEFCFTSPPYCDMRDYGGNLNLETRHISKFFQAPVALFAVNLGIKRKNNIIIQYWNDYIEMAKSFGHELLSWNVWDRSGGGFTVAQATAMFAIEHEFIFIFGKNKKELNKNIKNKCAGSGAGGIRQKNGSVNYKEKIIAEYRQMGTIFHSRVSSGEIRSLHPATFPVELPENYILACSNIKEIIFEPFSGSGSTLIACEKTSRRCFGMEIDPHYCTVICQRYIDYIGTDENVFVTRDGKRLKWQDLKNRNKSVGIGANDG